MKGHCLLCGRYTQLEKHHIFGGALRKKSERYGLYVYLCHDCHNEPPNGAHFNAEVMLKLHKYGQEKFMREQNVSKEVFMHEFYKNYL